LWTYLHLNVRNKLSFMNLFVQLLYSLRQGITTFCAMDPFESPVKPTDPFSQKCINIHKINYTDTDYVSSITIYSIDCTTQEPIMLKYSFQNI